MAQAWGLDFPGMSEFEARSVLRWVKQQGINAYGSVVDPRYFVTFSLDRTTAQWLLAALSDGLNEVLDDDDQARLISAEEARQGFEALTDPLKEFLSLGDPEPNGLG